MVEPNFAFCLWYLGPLKRSSSTEDVRPLSVTARPIPFGQYSSLRAFVLLDQAFVPCCSVLPTVKVTARPNSDRSPRSDCFSVRDSKTPPSITHVTGTHHPKASISSSVTLFTASSYTPHCHHRYRHRETLIDTAFTTHHLLISDQLKLTTTPPSISVTAFTQLRTATQHHREVSLTPATHLCPFVDHRESPPSPPLSRQLPQTRTTPLRDLSRVTATWTHGSRWLISSMTALARRGEVRVFLSRAEEKRKKRLAQWPAATSTVISGSDDALALGAVAVAVVAP
ncbi:hypothetical protein LR48_Vigan303s000200 [Vigna angularis]|uniref:Uncharacterized protein n=1 Tax=Phaseolus angularis TaxID=3914 RepID=A0A0L9T7K7_PHAAN|nr:hypothetical protein LR48_Vigan303s000200 [Vigna angularis]